MSQFKSGDEVYGVTNPQFVGANAEFAAAGNVGAYAVQFAASAGFDVVAVVGSKDVEYVRTLGAEDVIDYRVADFTSVVRSADVVIVTVGGETRERAFRVLKSGGILVTVVSQDFATPRSDVRSAFFYAEVTTARLNAISQFLESGRVIPHVGSVLPLIDVRTAHEMLAGAPHRRGKIMLQVA